MYFPVLQGPECLVPAPRELELAESTILAALDGALATQPVDPRKVFVAGFSQGGLMALALALRHPERFRGCAPVGGWLPPSFAAPAPAGSALPSILVCHSPQDPLIPSPLQEGTLKVLEKAGARAEAFDYEGGHRITGPVVARVVRWCAEKAGD
jgi:phospholipase/carboxylesterase